MCASRASWSVLLAIKPMMSLRIYVHRLAPRLGLGALAFAFADTKGAIHQWLALMPNEFLRNKKGSDATGLTLKGKLHLFGVADEHPG